jgi:hypothetical protein
MKISKTKHFWIWFQRHLATYYELRDKEDAEALFNLNELDMHLMVFGRNITMQLGWPSDGKEGNTTMIITARGDAKCFKKIERLVAQAPELPGWNIIALYPPMPVTAFIEKELAELNIDPCNLWFDPPYASASGKRIVLDIYAETYADITPKFVQAVTTVIFNILGEKVYGLEIDYLYVLNLLHLPKNQRTKLVNLQQLPEYVKLQELSKIVINGDGSLSKNNRL